MLQIYAAIHEFFGLDVGNGLLPFAVDIETPECVKDINCSWFICEILTHVLSFFFYKKDQSNLVCQFFSIHFLIHKTEH